MNLPVISFALPLGSEIRWSDMLAVLIATDPQPLVNMLNLGPVAKVNVQREAAVDPSHRPDIVVDADGQCLAVIEVKVLAGLGPLQLDGYASAVPEAGAYLVVFPQRLVIDLAAAPRWRGVSWETLLDKYRSSQDKWVATFAAAWLEHLDRSLPKVDAHTVWNDLVEGEDFVIAMRARMSWVYGQLTPPPSVRHDLVSSAAGTSWVARMYTDAQAPGYRVVAEVEENLPVREFPKCAGPGQRQPHGPSIRVCLLQHGVQTSAGFDWDYLLRMWPFMHQAPLDWVTNPAQPKAPHDRAGYQRIVAAGAPPYLGSGFGEAQTKISNACMFGARAQLPATITLGELATKMQALPQLIMQMAAVEPPQQTY
jgi:hypothetical protein